MMTIIMTSMSITIIRRSAAQVSPQSPPEFARVVKHRQVSKQVARPAKQYIIY